MPDTFTPALLAECPRCDGTGRENVRRYADGWSERIGGCDACKGTGLVPATCDGWCKGNPAITEVDGEHFCGQCAVDAELTLPMAALRAAVQGDGVFL